jgi:hypothetical protein
MTGGLARTKNSRRRGGPPKRLVLGRNHCVLRQTWPASADPQTAAPSESLLASDRTASDAADLAREIAALFPQHGYEKVTRCWWAKDASSYHRFYVSEQKRRPSPVMLMVGVSAALGLAALGGAAGTRWRGRAKPRRA